MNRKAWRARVTSAARVGVLAALARGCTSERAALEPVHLPEIESASVATNANNVLSAVVTAQVLNADSVRVLFHVRGSTGADSVTAGVLTTANDARVPMLGLLPSTKYVARAVAFRSTFTDTSDALDFRTDSLPSDVPRYSAAGSGPTPGFVAFGSGNYGEVIDNTGRVVWYHRFPTGPALNFMPQPSGRYVARPSSGDTTIVDPWLEIDPLGVVTNSFGCAGGLIPRFHDLVSDGAGGYWMMCDETRTMDLAPFGGQAAARVTGTVVQHVSAAGALLFQWSPFDHFQITDLDLSARTGPTVNWTHGNAIDLDPDGDVIISFRSLSEITKIDPRSGEVVWRMGGNRNQFALEGATPFARQHGVRMYAPGRLLILDNLGDALESRAEQYVVDEASLTVRLVHSDGAIPGVSTPIGGSVQHLPGNHVLVSYGTRGRVEEYDETGRMVWQITGNPGYVFRAQRIASLYAPGVGLSR